MNSEISEEKENYYSGIYDASRGTLNEDGLKLFLKSRNLFFDLNVFHPGDSECIRETIAYKRGRFEYSGNVKYIGDVPLVIHEGKEFLGTEALFFLDSLYNNLKNEDTFDPDFFHLYNKLMINNPKNLDSNKKIYIRKLNSKAITPKKLSNCLESGYTIFGTLTSSSSSSTSRLIYDTFLYITPPYGYYFEIHPHPNLYQLKHSFVNPTPIIFNQQLQWSQSLKFELKKKSETDPDIPENSPIALLIPKLFCHFQIEEIVLPSSE